MKEINVTGQKRTDLGKKASKHLRKQGMVPCNLYGEAKEDNKPVALAFAVAMSDLRKIVYTPHGELSFEGLEIANAKEVIVCSIKMTRQAAAAAAAAQA